MADPTAAGFVPVPVIHNIVSRVEASLDALGAGDINHAAALLEDLALDIRAGLDELAADDHPAAAPLELRSRSALPLEEQAA